MKESIEKESMEGFQGIIREILGKIPRGVAERITGVISEENCRINLWRIFKTFVNQSLKKF